MKFMHPQNFAIKGLVESNINYKLNNYKKTIESINVIAYNNLSDMIIKNPYYAFVDLESTGFEICEVGLVCCEPIYQGNLIHVYHRQYTYNTTRINSYARKIIHHNNKSTDKIFINERLDILNILNMSTHIFAKGVRLEKTTFFEVGHKMHDLNLLLRFPKIDYISLTTLSNFYQWLKSKNGIDPIDTYMRPHNPLVECTIFWFITRSMSPEEIIKSFSNEKAIRQWNSIVNQCMLSNNNNNNNNNQ